MALAGSSADFERGAIQTGYAQRWAGVAPDEEEVALTLTEESSEALMSRARAHGYAAARAADGVGDGADATHITPLAGAALATAGVPEQRTMAGDDAKRAWLDSLADSARPLCELAAAPPHGFRRRALFDALASHRVPLGRAVWYVRVVLLNQCAAPYAQQPGADPAAVAATAMERSRQWTADVCDCLAALLPEADGEGDGAARWQHAARLAAWTAGEGLVHAPELLEWVASNLRHAADAPLAFASLACAAAAGAAPAPQSALRLLHVCRRIAAAGDPHACTALRTLVGDALVSSPQLFVCGGLQDAAMLLPPISQNAFDLGCTPAGARALEAMSWVRERTELLADAVQLPCAVDCGVHAALDAAALSGDADAAFAAVFAESALLCARAAALCDWAVSEPWGRATPQDGLAYAPARALLGIQLLQRASERAAQHAAPHGAPPPLHAAVLGWAEEEVQHAEPRASRACALLAAAAAAGVVSAPAFVARAVAEGSLSRVRCLLLNALPAPGRDNSAEALQFTAERAAALAAAAEQPPPKRLRTAGSPDQPTGPAQQAAAANLAPLQEAVQRLLQLPAAKPAAGDTLTLEQAAAQIVGLCAQARSRMVIWCAVACGRTCAATRDSECACLSPRQAGCSRAARGAGAQGGHAAVSDWPPRQRRVRVDVRC
jgi:hypothetical protein